MDTSEKNRLIYRRQYLLVPESIACPYQANKKSITDSYTLYSHIDLVVNDYFDTEKQLVLLGDMFDYRTPQKTNKQILKDLIAYEFEDFLESLSVYSGRFVLFLVDRGNIFILHDATATRKVYFANHKNQSWVASQPHLLAGLLGYGFSNDPTKTKYFNSSDFKRLDYSSIGDTTCYDEIHQLIPNHYLEVGIKRIVRYWPKRKIEKRSIEDAVNLGAKMIKGFIDSITIRYDVMIPITSGKDSRLLLAGSHEQREKVYYYINKESPLTDNSPDIRVPKKMLQDLKVNFHVECLSDEVDDDFVASVKRNNPMVPGTYIRHFYNYYKKFNSRVNLPGNFAGHAWGQNKISEVDVSAETLADIYGLSDYDYAIKYYKNWLHAGKEIWQSCNFNIIQMFYWEERHANWATQTQLDKDIAQEDINPMNSRELIILFLSVERKFNNAPNYILHKRIIKQLWPELLRYPINPSFRNSLMKILKTVGIYDLIVRFRMRRLTLLHRR